MSVQVKSSGSSPILQSRTVTPSSSTQYITAQTGYDALSQVTVNRDSSLISSNIKSGTSIFNVTGTYTGEVVKVTPSSISYQSNYVNINFSSTLKKIQNMSFKIWIYYTDSTYSIAFPFYENNTWNAAQVYFSDTSLGAAPSGFDLGSSIVARYRYNYVRFWGYKNKSVTQAVSSDLTNVIFICGAM